MAKLHAYWLINARGFYSQVPRGHFDDIAVTYRLCGFHFSYDLNLYIWEKTKQTISTDVNLFRNMAYGFFFVVPFKIKKKKNDIQLVLSAE